LTTGFGLELRASSGECRQSSTHTQAHDYRRRGILRQRRRKARRRDQADVRGGGCECRSSEGAVRGGRHASRDHGPLISRPERFFGSQSCPSRIAPHSYSQKVTEEVTEPGKAIYQLCIALSSGATIAWTVLFSYLPPQNYFIH
jgi:hypothetical protein